MVLAFLMPAMVSILSRCGRQSDESRRRCVDTESFVRRPDVLTDEADENSGDAGCDEAEGVEELAVRVGCGSPIVGLLVGEVEFGRVWEVARWFKSGVLRSRFRRCRT